MSKKVVILSVIGGAAVGAVSAFFATKKYYEKVEQEEIASMHSYFEEKYGKIEPKPVKTEKKEPKKAKNHEIVHNSIKKPENIDTHTVNYYNPTSEDIAKGDDIVAENAYGGDDISDEDGINDEDSDEDMADGEHPEDDDPRPTKPYISCRGENPSNYISVDTISCTYFTKDHVLADDITNDIMDVESTIGLDVASEIENGIEDIYYVTQPEKREEDDIHYEISRDDESYKEVIPYYHAGGSK
jgi:hypothetical protein